MTPGALHAAARTHARACSNPVTPLARSRPICAPGRRLRHERRDHDRIRGRGGRLRDRDVACHREPRNSPRLWLHHRANDPHLDGSLRLPMDLVLPKLFIVAALLMTLLAAIFDWRRGVIPRVICLLVLAVAPFLHALALSGKHGPFGLPGPVLGGLL